MEWRDTGFVLSARRHGENSLIAELLTREHGRHAGLVRGGQLPRRRALLQPGNSVAASWRGRLPEHLGTLECELVDPIAARLLDDPDRLVALGAACALLVAALPEREPHGDLYLSFEGLLDALAGAPIPTATLPRLRGRELPGRPQAAPSPASGGGLGRGSGGQKSDGGQALDSVPAAAGEWARTYVIWEYDLLTGLGFGLDLDSCAATGTTEDLAYVSPRSGRAVSRAAGAPYHDKLLPLPAFLLPEPPARRPASWNDIAAGLALTEYFLLHHVLSPQGGRLPEARQRLADRMRRATSPGMIDG